MSFLNRSQPAPGAEAPAMVSLIKQAAVSLEKKGLAAQKAAVYLVLDRSGSMASFYGDGSVQTLAEQALGLSANLDDDGIVPLVFFDHQVYAPIPVSLASYTGIVQRENQRLGQMGGTAYAPAIRRVLTDYTRSGVTDPAFVIFQTDGDPSDRADTENALRESSQYPLFFSFVGFGRNVTFLKGLDNLSGRAVDNASFLSAPKGQLGYDDLLAEFPQWLKAATAAGILPTR
jgi:hypothetical protein